MNKIVVVRSVLHRSIETSHNIENNQHCYYRSHYLTATHWLVKQLYTLYHIRSQSSTDNVNSSTSTHWSSSFCPATIQSASYCLLAIITIVFLYLAMTMYHHHFLGDLLVVTFTSSHLHRTQQPNTLLVLALSSSFAVPPVSSIPDDWCRGSRYVHHVPHISNSTSS